MGKILTTTINDFSGGMTKDKRVQDYSKFALAKNFDIFTYPKKLFPRTKTVESAGPVNYKDFNIVKFMYASNVDKFYGLGVTAAGGTKACAYELDLSSIDANSWGLSTNGASGQNNRSTLVFFYYKTYGYLFRNSSHLCRFDTTGAGVFNDTYQAISYTNLAQPVHHPSDDCAYFFVDNLVYRLDNTTWDGIVLTLPNNQKIVSACPYGNYLAIATVTLGSVSYQSTVYLWDRDSSLTTISGKIDFGEGAIKHVANLNNKLIAVMDYYSSGVVGVIYGESKILIKQASGDSAVIKNELMVDNSIASIGTLGFVSNNILYFVAKPYLDLDTREGIWAVDENGKLSLDMVQEGATSYQGIYLLGSNVWFIAHSADGSVYHSDDTYSITNPSVLETIIFNDGDSSIKKKLLGITIMTEPLPVAGQIVLKYRKDEETSWTTIFTNTTDNSISHSAINIEASGANFPTYKEIQFQVSSTGGAIHTGIKFKREIIDDDIYG